MKFDYHAACRGRTIITSDERYYDITDVLLDLMHEAAHEGKNFASALARAEQAFDDYQQVQFDDLAVGDLFRLGNGENIYAKRNDGEYVLVRPFDGSLRKPGDLYVGREGLVRKVSIS